MKLSKKQSELLNFLKRNNGLQSIGFDYLKSARSLAKKGMIVLHEYEQRPNWKPYPQAKISQP